MPEKPNKSIMSSFMSFINGGNINKPKSPTLVGKIVGVDTNHKSSDNFNLIHIYRIVDNEGKSGAFLGNIKYKSKMAYFRKIVGKEFIDNIEGWRELTPDEIKMVNKV